MQVFALPFSPWQQQYKANNNIEKKYMDMDYGWTDSHFGS